eukprot:XP_025012847.1 receptor-like protein 15 [Ricinus communis]
MEFAMLKWLLLCLILGIEIKGKECCFEEERLGLLEFKAAVSSTEPDNILLSSWIHDPKSDCCAWERVTCNSTSSQVIELSLQSLYDFESSIYGPENTWSLNMSSFRHFKELRILDLSSNKISDSFDYQGFKMLSILKKLEVLDLSYNWLNGSILSSVSSLTSLTTLNLSFNSMAGSFPSQEFASFKNLEVLDLSLSEFTGTVPQHSWAPLSLKVLSLFGNHFNGSLTSFCGLKRLQQLDLSYNHFGGNLPPCLHNMTSLTLLDLSENQFTGHVSSLLASLKSLKYIDLSHNLFEGSFSFNLFAEHSSLEVVQFISDNNKSVAKTKYPDWIPPFQLQVLVLQNCGLESIPRFLNHQFKLKKVDLSHNKIKGNFPSWLFNNNSGLEYLSLKNNSFWGRFHLPTYSSFNNTTWLDVSDNLFKGQLQDVGGKMFPEMKFLNLSGNRFRGDFLFSPAKDCKLTILDLSFNNFSGEVPKKLLSSCVSLKYLKLSHNNFHGQIFTREFNLTGLSSLKLNDNQFGGTLSSLVNQFYDLWVLDLSNNHFHGKIPRWMGNFTNLAYLSLHNNCFEGHIFCDLFRAEYIDLSQNRFSGSLPSCFNMQSDIHPYILRYPLHINLQGNRFTGSIPVSFLNFSKLLTLNLRDNNFSGSIPHAFGAFPNLRALLLGGNRLNGLIPDWLCELNEVGILDLSMNSFSGSIPKCLYNLSFGSEGLHGTFEEEHWMYFIRTVDTIYSGGLIPGMGEVENHYIIDMYVKEEIEFVTKHRANTYKGDILNFMSGLDLSHNNLIGVIPLELGMLSEILALNISYNRLVGYIPVSFSNLTQLESLDLSHYSLSGQIPSELINLHFLEVFSVAYNNLSGRIPDMIGQFSTFDNGSYEGNPLLCGPQVERNCSWDNESPSGPMALRKEADQEKWFEIDHVVFFASFSVSFMMFFLGVITVLYINPYWRRRLYYYSEEFMFSCYYFVSDILSKLSGRRH